MRVRKHSSLLSGQATLEFALILPLLIFMTLGIFDLGRAIWYFSTVAEAAREGTRYAMVHGASSSNPAGPAAGDSSVDSTVRRYTVGLEASKLTVLSTWPDGDNRAGHRVTVEVRYNYVPLTTLIVGGATVPLHSVAVASIVF